MTDVLKGTKATAATRPTGVGGGTSVALALNAFRHRVEQHRTRERSSEASLPRSGLTRAESRLSSIVGATALHSHLTSGHALPRGSISAPVAVHAIRNVERGANDRRDVIQSIINASPGTFEDDDGSPEIADRYNFYAHGKRFLFATSSLGIFDETSVFRRRVIWLVTSPLFDRVVLALIMTNSIVLALPDLSKTNPDGSLDSADSLRNAIANDADRVFTILFFIECSLKIIAMGLMGERGAYLLDPWNWIDFAVVFVGIVAAIPRVPDVSGLRAFRVLRPLRFLNAVPGIKKLVTALLKSIPELLSVVAFLSFLFFLYGVTGVQLWSGVLHSRCRLTPFPVQLDPNITLESLQEYETRVIADPYAYRCRDPTTSHVIELDSVAWTHDTSPWRQPQVCYWPVANEATPQTCNLDGSSFRQCPTGQTCGSEYDKDGNFRFTHPNATVRRILLESSTFTASLNYGFTSFDNIGSTALVLFICMPREGWTDIMYMIQDAGFDTAAALYFISFVFFSSYFMLNLALAVIWENFSDQSFIEAEEERAQNAVAAAARKLAMEARDARRSKPSGSRIVGRLINHWFFNLIRTIMILLNTIILSLDQYPVDEQLSRIVDAANFALTVAIVAVNNFKGKLYSCNGDVYASLQSDQRAFITSPRPWHSLSMTEQAWFDPSAALWLQSLPDGQMITSREACQMFNATWGYTIPQSFDNVLVAWRTFYEISTTEGWVTIMLAAVDATEIDMQPIPNYREVWTFFFIAFIFWGSFFVIQLFIGVVIENFNRMKERLDAQSSVLETITMGSIILNTFIMALTYFGEEDLYGMLIEYSNYVFALVFTLEAVIKIVGLGRYYWKDKWNIFDFTIVLGSFIGLVYTWAGGSSVGTKFLDITIYSGNKVYFHEVARKLAKFVLDIVNEAPVEDLPSNIEVDQKWRILLRGSKMRKMERENYRLNHIHAAELIHQAHSQDMVKKASFTFEEFFAAFSKSVAGRDAGDASDDGQAQRASEQESGDGRTLPSLEGDIAKRLIHPNHTPPARASAEALPTFVSAFLPLQLSDGSWRFDDKFAYTINGVAADPPVGLSPKLWATAVVIIIWRQYPEYFLQLEGAYEKAMLHVDENVMRLAKDQVDLLSLHKIRVYQDTKAKEIREKLLLEAAKKAEQEQEEERRIAQEAENALRVTSRNSGTAQPS
ncbi:hypothetical protein ATCC90586_003826 [Pythium insidiosum]|nr:hypothetical protein ATCC90586_003826 [Pythium insidiosum]